MTAIWIPRLRNYAPPNRSGPIPPTFREVRSRLEYRFGNPAALVHKIDNGTSLFDNATAEFTRDAERSYLVARASPTPSNIDDAVRMAIKYSHPPYSTVLTLVSLGRTDEAYAVLRAPGAVSSMRKVLYTGILFRAQMRPFRLDRRFMSLADQLGLVAYWQSSGNWPDFCEDRDLPYDCRQEAHRLESRQQSVPPA